MLSISEAEARALLISYHLQPSTVAGVFDRLGSVQYDPLNPVGRNPDLVFQARVPGYRVDDWQHATYRERVAYDAWDKQASLVPVADWPARALIRERYHPWHDRQILDEFPEMVAAVFVEIDRRGPLSSLEFEDRRRAPERHSWYGPTIVKRVLRALWARGELVTHHRAAGRHYYDRPERVIPSQHLAAAPLRDENAYRRWVVARRHQSAGLLRPGASAEIWSVTGDAAGRAAAIADLVASGEIIPVHVGRKGTLYHLVAPALSLAGSPSPPRVTFLGPLDNLLWDRRAIRDLFGFEYIWEVYKRQADRRWGYYVLPVLHGDRFVARVDSRLEGKTWSIAGWWWEEGVERTPELLDALGDAVIRFRAYLDAEKTVLPRGLDRLTRSALLRRA
ncbi:MAG TPA: crosslink repair DNA glycosylase YcaQ family protein [Chloroflexota bacterium]|nr:crosslink repair DNA glycosylase YcaQ family protein [Chloroflexota bacterium]